MAHQEVWGDTVTNSEILHAFADRDDLASNIRAWNQVLLLLGEWVSVGGEEQVTKLRDLDSV